MDDINLKNEQPSQEYLKISQEPSHRSQELQKQLLILDLNGTLISRLKGNGKGYYVRPHYERFFDFIFQHFTVMVWSSARSRSVQMMCKIFKQPLELIWHRSHFDLDANQFYTKTETIKDLTKVWRYFSNKFNVKNTIILDDTDAKLVYQPYNLILIKTFDFNHITEGATDHELLKVIQYLDVLRYQTNVANFIRNEPFNSNNYSIVANQTLDTAMAHYNSKGKLLHIVEQLERRKRSFSQSDHDVVVKEKDSAKRKKKRKKNKNGETLVPSAVVASTHPTPVGSQTKKKTKRIADSIKQNKKPRPTK